MKFLKFLFTARRTFVLFALLAFAFTVLYLAWNHRNQERSATPRHPAAQVR